MALPRSSTFFGPAPSPYAHELLAHGPRGPWMKDEGPWAQGPAPYAHGRCPMGAEPMCPLYMGPSALHTWVSWHHHIPIIPVDI